jgi:BMFP domain-containing protein YqiC
MSEDMTYAPVETLAAARQRIAELEARLELVERRFAEAGDCQYQKKPDFLSKHLQ